MDQEIMPQQLTDFRDTWQNEDRDTLKLVARQQTEPWTSKSEIDLLRPQLVLGKDERRTQHWFYDTPGIVSSDQVCSFCFYLLMYLSVWLFVFVSDCLPLFFSVNSACFGDFHLCINH